jgi:hypothetical protein
LPKNYFKEVLPFLTSPSNAKLFYEVKADLSEQDIAMLAKARVKRIQPGIEALATSTLKLMKKGTTVFQNLFFLKNCALYGIDTVWNLLIGFPGEEEEVYEKYNQDLPWLRHLPPPAGVFPVRFDRYSPYFTKAKEYELDLRPLDFYKLIYPFPEDSLTRFAYYFADANYDAKYFVGMLRWKNALAEKVTSWVASWQDSAQACQPRLYFTELNTSPAIYDSRFGSVTRVPISEVSRQILELANKPKRLDDLGRELSHLADLDLEKEVSFLQQKGWLFQEGERYFNLVLDREPNVN